MIFNIKLNLTPYHIPRRPGVADSIAVLQNSQVRVVMITGDAEATAAAVARALGIRSEGRRMVSGADLEEMSEDKLRGLIDSVYCFYRDAGPTEFDTLMSDII